MSKRPRTRSASAAQDLPRSKCPRVVVEEQDPGTEPLLPMELLVNVVTRFLDFDDLLQLGYVCKQLAECWAGCVHTLGRHCQRQLDQRAYKYRKAATFFRENGMDDSLVAHMRPDHMLLRFTGLKHIDGPTVLFTDRVLRQLTRLEELTFKDSYYAFDTEITDHGIATLTRLHTLTLSRSTTTSITDEGLVRLAGSLRCLTLRGNKLTTGTCFRRLTNLTSLVLDDWTDRGKSGASLAGLDNLTSLHIINCSNSDFVALLNGAYSLETLELYNASRARNSTLVSLTRLHTLRIDGDSEINDTGLATLTNLRRLSLAETSGLITNAGVRALTNLDVLDVLQAPHINNHAFCTAHTPRIVVQLWERDVQRRGTSGGATAVLVLDRSGAHPVWHFGSTKTQRHRFVQLGIPDAWLVNSPPHRGDRMNILDTLLCDQALPADYFYTFELTNDIFSFRLGQPTRS